jgi:hypothetical protein
MKNLFFAALSLIVVTGIAYASEGYEYKGSHTGYDVNAERAVMNMIESQTDPKTEKVNIDGKAMKFEYFDNNFFPDKDGRLIGSVHLSDNDDQYVFDYYVEGDRVIKIMLYTENDRVINKQVYPEKGAAESEQKQ